MDILNQVVTMSIAELRKILKDNNITDVSTDKNSLIDQVTQVLQTNILINSILEENINNDENENNPVYNDTHTQTQDPFTIERQEQDIEYQKSLQIDEQNQLPLQFTPEGNYIIQQPEPEQFEELSPKSLREKRLQFYM